MPDETLVGGLNSPVDPGSAIARIGRYRILRLIGEGGMGSVYEAEQENPRRTVALKVIRPGLATASLLRRFEQESQVLGRLQHPGIAQIYEAGTADAGHGVQPYFAMELVRGLTLDAYVAKARLGTRERLELLARICDAVEHAHQKGIVHRDLKPGNILVDLTGQPKILDFGVARATDSDIHATTHTEIGTIVGTLPYMSPEQVGADPAELDTRSDVYSLGVILYEMLAGRLPHDLRQKALPEIVRVIREVDPSPLSSVSRTFRGDVDTITVKALSKEKGRRYQSAADLAADIRRYLKDEPIVARPSSTAYQLRKFARRNKVLVAGVLAVIVALAAGVVVSSLQARRATKEAAKAEAVNAFLTDMLSSVDPNEMKGRDVTVRQVLDEAAKRVGDGSLAAQPDIEASARNTLGMTYKSLGLYPEAETHLKAAVDLRKRLLGPGDPAVATALNNLGLVLQERGDLEGAEPLFREADAIWRKALGDENARVATGANNLGWLLYLKGDFDGSEPFLREAVAIRRKVLGDEDTELAMSLNNLANLVSDGGRDAEAEPLYEEALAIQRKVKGPEHPDVALTETNLANLIAAREDFDRAEELYRDALAINRKAFGDDHPEIAWSLNSLGLLYQKRDNLAAAEQMHTEALAIRRKSFGDEHSMVAQSLNNLASVRAARGDLAGAETAYRESLEILRKAVGGDHPNTGMLMHNLAKTLHDEGKLAAAEPLYRQTLAVWRKALGEDHPNVSTCLGNLGQLLLDQGDPAAAEPLLRESLAIATTKYPARHTSIANCQATLGLCLIREGKPAEAEPLLREALSIREEKLPVGSMFRSWSQSLLGEALATQKKFDEAEPLLLEGCEGLEASPGASELRKREGLERVQRLYKAWGKRQKPAA